MSILSTALKKLSAGHKQSDIAKRLGVSQAYLSDMLNGRRRINPPMLDKLADLLSIDRKSIARLHKVGAREQGWRV